MSATIDLRRLLDAYASNTLNAMRSTWPGKASAAGKPGRIEELTALLSNAAGVRGAVAGLDAEEAAALYHAEQLGPTSLHGLRSTLAGLGLRKPEETIHALLERGLLLALPLEGARMLAFNELWDWPQRRVVALPMASGLLQAPPLRKERLPTVDPSLLKATRSPDPGRLARATLALAALGDRKKLKITGGGWISATHLTGLERDLGLDEALPLPLVYEVARSAGLLIVDEGGLLRPSGPTTIAVRTPLRAQIDVALTGFLADGRWWDDLPLRSGAETLKALRDPPWNLPSFEVAAHARGTVLSVLRRLRVSGWMHLDGLVSLTLARDPGLLTGLERRFWGGGPRARRRPDSPQERARQVSAATAFVARTLFAFGLVELGSTTGEFPDFSFQERKYSYWSSFQDTAIARHRPEERAKPLWEPEPSPVYFRVTPLGRQILWGEAAPEGPEAAAGLRIGPDFEIVALLDAAPPEALFRLELIARPLPGHPSDRARRFCLERARWIAALRSGVGPEALMEQLVAWSGRPLPDNVARTLQDWTDRFGLVSVHAGLDLIEFRTETERAEALARWPGEPVGDRFALVPQGSLNGGTIFDYSRPPPACLDVAADGAVAVDADRADLLLDQALARFAEGAPGAPVRHLTAASVRASKWSADQILTWLERQALRGVPPGLALAIRGWRGALPALPLAAATVLQVQEPAIAEAILARPELAVNLAGTLAPTVLVVRPGRRAALVRALGALGIAAGEALRLE